MALNMFKFGWFCYCHHGFDSSKSARETFMQRTLLSQHMSKMKSICNINIRARYTRPQSHSNRHIHKELWLFTQHGINTTNQQYRRANTTWNCPQKFKTMSIAYIYIVHSFIPNRITLSVHFQHISTMLKTSDHWPFRKSNKPSKYSRFCCSSKQCLCIQMICLKWFTHTSNIATCQIKQPQHNQTSSWRPQDPKFSLCSCIVRLDFNWVRFFLSQWLSSSEPIKIVSVHRTKQLVQIYGRQQLWTNMVYWM